MTLAQERARLGREPVHIVELDLDFCSRTYGVAPCTAAVGVTGNQKCWNARGNCQDSANYDKTTKIYRYSSIDAADIVPPSGADPVDWLIFGKCVQSVTYSPTTINPGKTFGIRERVTVVLKDFADPDINTDPYVNERTYNPIDLGTHFSKLKKRNKYYNNRIIRIKTGYITDELDIDNFEIREYLIESISNPNSKREVTIVGVDPLKLADNDRALVPAQSKGVLSAAINASATSITLQGITTAEVDAAYPSPGYVTLSNKEVVSYTHAAASLTFTIVRAQDNTVAQSHSADSAVQWVKEHDDELFSDIIYDYLINTAGVPASFINKTQWDDEADTYLAVQRYTTKILKPTPVKTLINEMLIQTQSFIWWVATTSLIPLRAVRPLSTEVPTVINYTRDILAGTIRCTDKPDQRITRQYVYFGRFDPTKNLKEPSNYETTLLGALPEEESENFYDDIRNGESIYSRWLQASDQALASAFINRTIGRNKDIPRVITIDVDASLLDSVAVGDVVILEIEQLQDETGALLPTEFMIIKLNEYLSGTSARLTLLERFFNFRTALIGPNTLLDYVLETDANKNKYGFICDTVTLKMSNGDPPTVIA